MYIKRRLTVQAVQPEPQLAASERLGPYGRFLQASSDPKRHFQAVLFHHGSVRTGFHRDVLSSCQRVGGAERTDKCNRCLTVKSSPRQLSSFLTSPFFIYFFVNWTILSLVTALLDFYSFIHPYFHFIPFFFLMLRSVEKQ